MPAVGKTSVSHRRWVILPPPPMEKSPVVRHVPRAEVATGPVPWRDRGRAPPLPPNPWLAHPVAGARACRLTRRQPLAVEVRAWALAVGKRGRSGKVAGFPAC